MKSVVRTQSADTSMARGIPSSTTTITGAWPFDRKWLLAASSPANSFDLACARALNDEQGVFVLVQCTPD